MKKSLLYTGTGDQGQTSLVGGQRIAKNSPRLEAYGTVDEFSSFLGIIHASTQCDSETKGQLAEIQNELFNIGCYLATDSSDTSSSDETNQAVYGLTETDITRLEGWIDALDERVPTIRSFVLPGGSEIAAHTHVARTVCRRAERRILTLAAEEFVSPLVIRYFNRLSDYLFILARYYNFLTGIEEVTWRQPGK
ncbi:MAG: cob(I)yrinic acid a,c-diamide adenosyltransferase [Bacteroidales bacterium]|nr:cob(I)yrinic acid a,c-diamide adenosyltransferase [Bacteroidales bacterium]